MHALERVKEVGSLGAEHKPGTNENFGSAVKQHAETIGHGIHPNYASILDTDEKPRTKGSFCSHYIHPFQDQNSVNERAPFTRVYESLVSSLRGNEH